MKDKAFFSVLRNRQMALHFNMNPEPIKSFPGTKNRLATVTREKQDYVEGRIEKKQHLP